MWFFLALLQGSGICAKALQGSRIYAKALRACNQVLTNDGTCVIIEEITVEQLSEPETTYNFEVADFHTYYVTESNVLVHNKCPKPNIEKTVLEGYEPTYKNGVYESNPKHGKVPHGDVSKNISSVEYGQYALDKSVAAGSSRMSFNGKEFLIFKQHSPGVWHGYATNYAGLVGRQIQMNVARTVFNVWR